QVLGSGAGYISVVASRRRAAVILERLKQRGVPPERLARLKAPAGLDIGAVTPEEIAVSILAEIIQHHRSEKDAWPETEHRQAAARVTEARDPICGMLVEVGTAGYRSEVSGQLVYFCCHSCKQGRRRCCSVIGPASTGWSSTSWSTNGAARGIGSCSPRTEPARDTRSCSRARCSPSSSRCEETRRRGRSWTPTGTGSVASPWTARTPVT